MFEIPNVTQLTNRNKGKLCLIIFMIPVKSFFIINRENKNTPPMKNLRNASDNGPTEPCNILIITSVRLHVKTAIVIMMYPEKLESLAIESTSSFRS